MGQRAKRAKSSAGTNNEWLYLPFVRTEPQLFSLVLNSPVLRKTREYSISSLTWYPILGQTSKKRVTKVNSSYYIGRCSSDIFSWSVSIRIMSCACCGNSVWDQLSPNQLEHKPIAIMFSSNGKNKWSKQSLPNSECSFMTPFFCFV